MLIQKPREIAITLQPQAFLIFFCKLQNPQEAECLYKGCLSLVNKHHTRRPGSTICLGLNAYVCQYILICHKSMLYRQASRVAWRGKQDNCVTMSLWDTGEIIPLITATLLLLPESACSVPGGTVLYHTEIYCRCFWKSILNLKQDYSLLYLFITSLISVLWSHFLPADHLAHTNHQNP